MTEDSSSEPLVARLSRLDSSAWSDVYETIFPQARQIIHSKFGPDKRHWSADDALNSACRTTYGRLKLGLLNTRLESWEDLRRLLVLVASNKIIDSLRKSSVEARWMERVLAEIRDDEISAVLKELLAKEHDRSINGAIDAIADSLEDEVERLVFRGKMDGLKEEAIAVMVEAKSGTPMSKGLVRERWRTIRGRLKLRFADLPAELWDSGDDRPSRKVPRSCPSPTGIR